MDLPRYALRSLASASALAASVMSKAATSMSKAAASAHETEESAPRIKPNSLTPVIADELSPLAKAQQPAECMKTRRANLDRECARSAHASNERLDDGLEVEAKASCQPESTPTGLASIQRFSFTRPSSRYLMPCDGRLFAQDVSNGYKTLLEMELRSYHLSPMEKRVAKQLLVNRSNQDIGRELLVSESTVKYHVRNIYKKTQSKGRSGFTSMMHNGIERSTHSWGSRRDLELEMESLHLL